ncbi:MAG: hypothetical protein CFE28_14045 [Alphaproteobacteria bacterium PA2]|nr:MAG: hypothetical protein CFE28_14045 [Alphaproteobacteria bacterium PA2]
MRIKTGLSAFACAALIAAALPASAADALTAHEKKFNAALSDAKALAMTNPANAEPKIQNLYAIANEAEDEKTKVMETAAAQWLQAEAIIRTGRAEDALPLLDKALASISGFPKSKIHGDLIRSRGNAYVAAGKVQLALPDLQSAHDVYREAGEPRGQAMSLLDIGTIYQNAGDFPRVLQYYKQAEEAYSADPNLAYSLLNNKAMVYKYMGKLPEAIVEFKKAKDIAFKLDSKYLEAITVNNISVTNIDLGNIVEADKYAAISAGLMKFEEARSEKPFLNGIIAQIQFKKGNIPAASNYLGKAFSGQDLEKTPPAFSDLHKYAVGIYSAAGNDHLAFLHLKAYKRLDDETRALAADTNAALMAAKFDFANQDLKIANLKAGQLQRDIKLARFRTMITMVLLAGLVIIAGLLVVGLLSLKRSRDQVRAANVNLNEVNTSLEKALKAKTEFLATTSHEVRTPLNGILGMTQVILADQRVDAAMRDKISIVHGAAETMRALVDDILDVAKIENGNLSVVREETDLTRILEETARMWREKAATKSLGFKLDIEGAPKRIVEDGTRLRQVLFNLLSNAIKFTDTGEVGLTARVIEKNGVEHLALSVSDTGIGIPSDQFDDVFVSFKQLDGGTTRQHGGTGLGLTICRNLATAMDGDITIESVVGEGSVFTVVLPLTRVEEPVEVEVSESDETSGPRSLADSTVLLVEANPLAQSMMKAALAPHVRALEIVGSGALALSTLEQKHFDRIILEGAASQLPDIERLESIRTLLEAARNSPVSVLWSQPTEDDTQALLALGVAQVLAKPMSPQAIVERLKESCETVLDNFVAQPELKSLLTA